jgi:uncharacterized protein (DUF2126 family)
MSDRGFVVAVAIVRENGELEYLKTYRLSVSQTKRVYLLSQLAAHEWTLAATAATLNNTLDELVKRLEKVWLFDRSAGERTGRKTDEKLVAYGLQ